MKSTLEREVKLRPGERFAGIRLDGDPIAERVLISTYYDTVDLRLADGSITLRRRAGDDGDAVWQLKLPTGDNRLELEWPAPNDAVPEHVRRLLIAHTRGRPLSAVATLRTRRTGVTVREDGVGVADVVEDSVEVLHEDRPVRTFEEIEVELVSGDAKAIRRIEKRLRRAGADDPDGRPKLFQALDVSPGRRRRRPRGRRARLVAALQEQNREILTHDPATRLGDDPNALHDHRVAVRRLRAMLRAGRPLLDQRWADDLRQSWRTAGRALADVRDLDVLLTQVETDAQALDEPMRSGARDLLERLQTRRDQAHRELSDALCEAWYVSLLNRLERAVEAPRFAGSGSLSKELRKEHRRAQRHVRRLAKQPSDRDLHEVRKAVKRARYAAELGDAVGAKGTRKYIKRAKDIQDVLGDHQDAIVAANVLAELDREVTRPVAHMAAEALIDRQLARRAEARAAFPKAWARFDKRGRTLKPRKA